jgi:hypothetical protein
MRTRAKTVALSAIDFVISANVRRKRNKKVKERPQQALEKGLDISHRERYSSLCLAQILIYTYSVLFIIIILGLSCLFFGLYSSSFDSSLQDGAPHYNWRDKPPVILVVCCY